MVAIQSHHKNYVSVVFGLEHCVLPFMYFSRIEGCHSLNILVGMFWYVLLRFASFELRCAEGSFVDPRFYCKHLICLLEKNVEAGLYFVALF